MPSATRRRARARPRAARTRQPRSHSTGAVSSRVDLAVDLDEAEPPIQAVHRPRVERRRVDHGSHVSGAGVRDHQRRRPDRAGQAAHGDAVLARAVPAPATARSPAARPRSRRRARDRWRRRRRGRAPTTCVAASPWSSNNRDTAARGSNESASCQPSSAERGVQRVAGVLFRRVAQAALEQLEVVPFDHRSFPRSRSRRAMMLRWISEVPP